LNRSMDWIQASKSPDCNGNKVVRGE
jgi:hypothetical protein